jgi:putative phosphoribosyl transferase
MKNGDSFVYKKQAFEVEEQIITVELGKIKLEGELVIPEDAPGIVVIPAAKSSIKQEHRLRYLAHLLCQAGLATILIHLLTQEEDLLDQRSKHFRSNIRHLATRLVGITDWLAENSMTCNLKIAYFGASADGGAALLAAAERNTKVCSVVARSGYTYLIGSALSYLQAPTLLIVGGVDYPTIAMNEDALLQIAADDKQLEIIPNASHKFQEPGTLEEAARLANQWFKHHFQLAKSNRTCFPTLSLC